MSSRSQSAQFKAANPRSSVWVSASAGTGKTRVLVNRILRLLLDGNTPEKLLCITYTKSAAAEILERISDEAAKWATSDDTTLQKSLADLLDRAPNATERALSRTLLPRILQASGGMRIMTIHAFCQSVLSRFPLEAGISGNFEICDEQQSHDLLSKAKQNLLLKTTPDSHPDLFQALTFLYDRIGEDIQDRLISSVVKKRHKLEKLYKEFGDYASYKRHLCKILSVDENVSFSSLDDQLLRDIPHKDLPLYLEVLLSSDKPTPRKLGEKFQNFINEPTADNYHKIFSTKDGSVSANPGAGIDKKQIRLLDFLEKEKERITDYNNKRSSLDLMLSSTSLYLCCFSLLNEYKNLKRAANLLDYEDQILLTEKLLTELSDCRWVLYKLDAGIDHVLLDEAQDTSPSQWSIIESLADEFFETSALNNQTVRTTFVVGDEKQSIFSFQNADPASFSLMKDGFKEKAHIKQHSYEDLSLIENYRSSSIILDYVDLIFDDEKLKNSISHINKKIKHEAFHAEYAGQIDIWPLVPVQKDAADFVTSENILAKQIALNVQNLLNSKISLDGDKPLMPGHVMILVRKRYPMVNPLVKAFKDLNIPVRSIDRLLLSDQLVIQDCLSALNICLNPHDNYTVSCFLKSPFIGCSEDDLFNLAHKREGSVWQNLLNDSAYANVVSYYNNLIQAAASNIPYQFFHTLLSHPCPADERSGKHALIRRLGYDTEDILDQFLDAMSSYQQKNTASNQGFVTWLLNSDATTKSQGMNADESHVRIMTVHASKGLQAPIVFMVDAHSKPEGYKSVMDVLWREQDASFLWAMKPGSDHPIFDNEKQEFLNDTFDEYYRLLYVALTRAKNRLVVCGCAQSRTLHKDFKSWHELAVEAVAKLSYTKTEFDLFGQKALSASKETKVRAEQVQTIPTKEIFQIPAYLTEKPPAEPLPHFPLRPSQLPGRKQAVFSPLSSMQASSFIRGEILHKLFYAASNYPKEEQPAILNRILDNYTQDPKEKSAFYDEVWAILSNDRFAALFSPQSRAEVPIVGQITLDGTLYNVNGQIDRLLIEKDRVLIVDFKTNRPASMSEQDVSENYKFQLAAYKMILQKIYPDKRVETAILWTSVPYLLPLSL